MDEHVTALDELLCWPKFGRTGSTSNVPENVAAKKDSKSGDGSDNGAKQPVFRFSGSIDPPPSTRTRLPDSELGDVWTCNSLKAFNCSMTSAKTVRSLVRCPQKEAFLNSVVPQEFQGIGSFMIEVKPGLTNMVKMLDMIKPDGNGGWNQKQAHVSSFSEKGNLQEPLHVFTAFFNHSAQRAFKKTISYVVESDKSRLIKFETAPFVVVQYYWKGGEMTPFDPEKLRKPKLPVFYREALQCKFIRGSPKSSPGKNRREAYNEVIEETPTMLQEMNAGFSLASVHQVANARRKIKKEEKQLFNAETIQFMLQSPFVETVKFCFSRSGHVEQRLIHFVYMDYQLDLLAQFGFGSESVPVYLDTKEHLTDALVSVIAFTHPSLAHKETGTNYIIVGPMMISHSKDKETYDRFAQWLHGKLATRKDLDYPGGVGNLKLITDDLLPMYGPFVTWFRVHHGLCYNRINAALRRKFIEFSVPENATVKIRRDIFGCPADNELGLIDEPDIKQIARLLSRLECSWASPQFVRWFKKNLMGKLQQKLSTYARDTIGLGTDFTVMNPIDVVDRLLSAGVAGGKLSELELVERLLKVFEAQKQELACASLGQGNYAAIRLQGD